MATKREILDLLSREELAERAQRLDVTVWDRRNRAHMAERLDEKGFPLSDLLARLPRERLKELCRKLGLDDGGKVKAALIDRLAGAAGTVSAAPPQVGANGTPTGPGQLGLFRERAEATGTRSSSRPPAKGAPEKPAPVTPREFGSFGEIIAFIWSIAELLRGVYKPYEYGQVVLPFTVLRRLDCVLVPTREKVREVHARRKGAGRNIEPYLLAAAKVPFYNTSNHDFATLTEDPDSIADHLNEYLDGFSSSAKDVTDHFNVTAQIDKLAGANLLLLVVKRFAQIDLHPQKVDNHTMGSIFEELIRRFSEQSNESAGAHFTPRDVIRLMVRLLFSGDDQRLKAQGFLPTLYDPACGTGGMLSIAEDEFHRLNLDPTAKLRVFGQELNAESYAICKADMMIKGQDANNIKLGNSFTGDGHREEKFNYLLSNPPFGVDWKAIEDEITNEHEEQGDKGRFGAGLPRVSDGALLFLQHMISKMKPVDPVTGEGGSRLAIVLNGSPLFTGEAGSGESEIRRWIIKNDWLEAIVALPDQLFYNTGISTYIWVVTNRKPKKREGRVLLVNAVDLSRKMRKSLGNKRNELDGEHIEAIGRMYDRFTPEEDAKTFDNDDFGYHRIVIERPLRLNFQASAERIERLREKSDFQKLRKSKKTGSAGEQEAAAGKDLQSRILGVLRTLDGSVIYKSRAAFEAVLETAFAEMWANMTAPVRRAVLHALSERDETAEVFLDSNGRPEADPELRDYENVPLKVDIATYFEREVRPHVPDAWIAGVDIQDGNTTVVDEDKIKVGYEIPITRHFYKYEPPRSPTEIKLEIRELGGEIQRLLQEALQ